MTQNAAHTGKTTIKLKKNLIQELKKKDQTSLPPKTPPLDHTNPRAHSNTRQTKGTRLAFTVQVKVRKATDGGHQSRKVSHCHRGCCHTDPGQALQKWSPPEPPGQKGPRDDTPGSRGAQLPAWRVAIGKHWSTKEKIKK